MVPLPHLVMLLFIPRMLFSIPHDVLGLMNSSGVDESLPLSTLSLAPLVPPLVLIGFPPIPHPVEAFSIAHHSIMTQLNQLIHTFNSHNYLLGPQTLGIFSSPLLATLSNRVFACNDLLELWYLDVVWLYNSVLDVLEYPLFYRSTTLLH